jgi:hypothetical protein
MSTSIRKLYFALFFFAGFFSVFSQTKKNSAGSIKQNTQKINKPSKVQQAASTAPTQCLNKNLSLVIHIVTDSLNKTNITQAQINTGLATLNADFSPICLSFSICKQDTIYNYKYYQFNNPEEIAEVHQVYEVKSIINVYIVGGIIPAPEAGFASFTGNYMVLSHRCVTDGKCWSHEMGHFFSLFHTFETASGAELVNGSNCTTAGDLICDTPADINPAPVNGACQWSGVYKDANLQLYTPIIGNIMSYHPSVCKTPFTVGQLNRMLNYFISYRNYLY